MFKLLVKRRAVEVWKWVIRGLSFSKISMRLVSHTYVRVPIRLRERGLGVSLMLGTRLQVRLETVKCEDYVVALRNSGQTRGGIFLRSLHA